MFFGSGARLSVRIVSISLQVRLIFVRAVSDADTVFGHRAAEFAREVVDQLLELIVLVKAYVRDTGWDTVPSPGVHHDREGLRIDRFDACISVSAYSSIRSMARLTSEAHRAA